jgi:hypothetical protein
VSNYHRGTSRASPARIAKKRLEKALVACRTPIKNLLIFTIESLLDLMSAGFFSILLRGKVSALATFLYKICAFRYFFIDSTDFINNGDSFI